MVQRGTRYPLPLLAYFWLLTATGHISTCGTTVPVALLHSYGRAQRVSLFVVPTLLPRAPPALTSDQICPEPERDATVRALAEPLRLSSWNVPRRENNTAILPPSRLSLICSLFSLVCSRLLFRLVSFILETRCICAHNTLFSGRDPSSEQPSHPSCIIPCASWS